MMSYRIICLVIGYCLRTCIHAGYLRGQNCRDMDIRTRREAVTAGATNVASKHSASRPALIVHLLGDLCKCICSHV